METLLGIVIGVLATGGGWVYFQSLKEKKIVKSQSVLLLDKIKKVCKLITVEGDFAEIYHYEDVKEKFLKLISSKKKALVVINAKAHVGFNLSKLNIQVQSDTKTVFLNQFPAPEILSIETNLNYYDKKDGYFNRFEASDLTELHQSSKAHIQEKIPESGLIEAAKKEAIETIYLIESMIQTIGWKLDYTGLSLENESKLITPYIDD